ncbi:MULTISPECIES: homoserine O-succinyltransferase [unclassified Streptomyces]|uniref:homoserine O-acetyltransferase/O-succinyltransferase family protein n=1 Tax=unclassified Streptomyces TaxID=2593676 RepID=UPI000CD4B44F|nr:MULTISPECIES: homoserine O-succinyltransferase [unclassified Streptomyces]AWL37034.1 homoserine O-succinyltransferase [Streptomyces sp. SM18]
MNAVHPPAGTTDDSGAAPRYRLAVVNLMPQAEIYLDYMERVLPPGTEVRWIRVRDHAYRSSDPDILSATHRYYDESAVDECDALLLTGAAVDIDPDLTAATYWDEIVRTLRDADGRVGSIAGVCWGAQVLGKVFYDIDKEHFPAKVFGVLEMTNEAPGHPLMRGLDDRYWLPHSRYARMEPDGFGKAVADGLLVPLDRCEEAGHTTVVSADGAHLMLQGHQDYPTERLAQEYHSAVEKGRATSLPLNYDPDRPVNRWRANNRAFLAAWLELAATRKRGLAPKPPAGSGAPQQP